MHARLAALLLWLAAAPLAGAAATPPAVMLATDYVHVDDVTAYWVSEKLDGVRGYWDGRKLWTRAGHAIDAPAWFVEDWPAVPMDGELWIGRGRFDAASGVVRAGPDDAGWRRLRFMVFDLPAHDGPFQARLLRIRMLLARTGVPWLQPVAQTRVAGDAGLADRFARVVAGGGEGLVLHHRDARYRSGRSDALLKLKPHADAEARVVAHTEGRGKYAGMLGALLVEAPDGRRFRLGSGFSDAERAAPPPVGSHVTYRYTGTTRTGLPRFARFLRVRHDMPPPDPR